MNNIVWKVVNICSQLKNKPTHKNGIYWWRTYFLFVRRWKCAQVNTVHSWNMKSNNYWEVSAFYRPIPRNHWGALMLGGGWHRINFARNQPIVIERTKHNWTRNWYIKIDKSYRGLFFLVHEKKCSSGPKIVAKISTHHFLFALCFMTSMYSFTVRKLSNLQLVWTKKCFILALFFFLLLPLCRTLNSRVKCMACSFTSFN